MMKNRILSLNSQFFYTFFISVRRSLEKNILLFMPLPVWMLILGIRQLIENTSPGTLVSIWYENNFYYNYLEQYFLILTGAFGLTLIFWVYTRKIWSSQGNE